MKTLFSFLFLGSLLFLLFSCNQDSWSTQNISSQEQENQYTKSLSQSPRHQEWIEIKNGDKTIYNWIVYPESTQKSSVVLLIHENKWLSDWVRNMADQIAAQWYIAIAPDLLSSYSETMMKTSDFSSESDATDALYSLEKDSILSDLQAVIDYAYSLPAANGNVISAWFCWGGSQSFQLAGNWEHLKAAMVFYGTWPQEVSGYTNITVPVYWFYGENDERVNATIEQTNSYMDDYGKVYEYEIYQGAWHAFMRLWEESSGTDPNAQARNLAWKRFLMILSQWKE